MQCKSNTPQMQTRLQDISQYIHLLQWVGRWHMKKHPNNERGRKRSHTAWACNTFALEINECMNRKQFTWIKAVAKTWLLNKTVYHKPMIWRGDRYGLSFKAMLDRSLTVQVQNITEKTLPLLGSDTSEVGSKAKHQLTGLCSHALNDEA